MENILSRTKCLTLITIALFLNAGMCFELRANSVDVFDLPALQQQQVTGTVTDENGLPIPGVAVRIKNSSIGTVTDPDGVYTINAAPDAIIIFTYLGFQSMEVPVDFRNEINVGLEEDVTALGEVEINAGYYYTTRRESTGNISRVTAEEIELQPVVSPIAALQGRMAGVEIIPGGSYLGTASTIRIRGTNSLREDGNYPLYIIDGVPVNSTPIDSYSNLGAIGIDPLNTMNLSNIESIEVLKDADATAIYGSRGANGVVLVTTKKAREGKMQLQANVYTGASTVPNRVDLLDTQHYLEIRRRAFENDGIEPTKSNAYDLLLWDQNRYTDWQDVFFGSTSEVTDVNLSVSGGTDKNSFRLTGSYHKQGTVFVGDYDYNKVTTSLQANHSSENKKLNLDLSVNFGVDNHNMIGYLSLTPIAFNLPPNAPRLFEEDGSLHWEDWTAAGLNNPLQGYHNTSNTKGQNLNSNLVVSYEFFNGFSFRTNFGYTTYNGDELVKRPIRSNNPANSQNTIHRSTHQISHSNTWIVEPQLIFNKQFGDHRMESILGGTFQQSERSVLGLGGEGYVSEALIGNLGAADLILASSNSESDYRYSAVFGRIGYNWKKKYIINLTGRRDGSSRFGPGKRIANFGAVGAAWILSEERFFKNTFPSLSFGKIRGNYGTTGNDQIGDYGYLDAYESTTGPEGLYPSQLANPDYSWEINKKLELAMELGFLRDRIHLGLSWFRNKSSNQLVGYSLPALTGFSSIQANLPATVENTGWEIEAFSYNIQNQNFTWQTSLNFTIPKNRLVEYPDLDQSSYANTYRVGHPLNISLLYQYSGLDPETGFYTVKDANENDRIDIADRTEVWDRGRKFYGGISNNLNYKKFSLQFLFQFVKQEGMLTMFDAGALGIQRAEVWEALQTNSEFQFVSSSSAASRAYTNVLSSTLPIVDASFIRLKSFSVGYSLPESFLRSISLRSGKVFFNAHNLLTFTKYKGLDPENSTTGTSFSGLRTITVGVQLTL